VVIKYNLVKYRDLCFVRPENLAKIHRLVDTRLVTRRSFYLAVVPVSALLPLHRTLYYSIVANFFDSTNTLTRSSTIAALLNSGYNSPNLRITLS
jgi:hypothetical protein